MRAWRLQPSDIETGQLLVSELVTNSVKHTRGSAARMSHDVLAEVKAISLTLRYHDDRLIIEVYDSDPAPPVLTEVGPDSESGHGLVLVQADGPDVLTWFELRTAAAPACPVANWSHMDNGKIDRIRVAFDPRPLLGG
jgi:hypothetical protein